MNVMLQKQSAITNKLLSEELLQNVSVVSLRELQLTTDPNKSVIEAARVWLKKRNNKTGAGILVGMPTLQHNFPNVAGPERTLLTPVSIFAQPSINNLDSVGTKLDAEIILDYCGALLSRFQIEGLGTLYINTAVPNLEMQGGVLRYDMIVSAEVPRDAIVPVVLPSYVCPAQTVTLTNDPTFADAAIYYTTDETFPGRDPVTGNPLGTAIRYIGAVGPLAVGTKFSWSAYKVGYAGSDVGQIKITA
jgi:hypothetical protein